MKKLMSLVLFMVWLSGCVAEPVSDTPGATAFLPSEGVIRQPGEEISLTDIKKGDLIELVSRSLLDYIQGKVGLNAERVQINEQDSIKLIATKNKVNAIMIMKIRELKIFSLEETPQAREVGLSLELIVFDDSGKEVYRRTVKQNYGPPVEISGTRPSADLLVEAAVKVALKQYAQDPELKKIIAKFKYGTVGGVIAGIL